MAFGFRWFRWLALLVLVGRLFGQFNSAPNQAWLGVWAGELPGYGTVVLKVSVPAPDKPLHFELWWLFYDVNLVANTSNKPACQPRLEEGTLYLDRLRHTNYSGEAAPGLAFRLAAPEEMRLASYGVLHPIMPPIWANLVLRKDPTSQAWYNRHENSAKLAGWKMLDRKGNLAPLPASWPAAVVMPTALLFSHNSSTLKICLMETDLPVDFLRTICAMAQEVGLGASFTTEAWRALAANPHTPTEVLDKIWAHPDELRAWYLAAVHPQARPEWRAGVVDRVMRGGDQLKSLAAGIEAGPDELYPRLIADSAARRAQLAANWEVPDFVHELLARDHAAEVGDVLAQNPRVPVAVLDTLAAGGGRERQFKLLSNKSLRPETRAKLLRELVATATMRDYRRLAHQVGVPPEFLAKCVEDPDPGVRIDVLRNPGTSQATLVRLAGDESTSVAWQAWEKLQERFPGTPGVVPPTVPRKAASLSPSVEDQCDQAVAANDLARLGFLLGYLRERNGQTFPYIDAKVAQAAVKEYRPECMDLILASGPADAEALVTNLAAVSAHDARWLDYFKPKGAFNGRRGGDALAQALYAGRNDDLAALLAAGLDPNLRNFQYRTPLHHAVIMRNSAAMEMLLQAGADPALADSEKLTPLDLAVRGLVIPAIKRLDTTGAWRDRVEAFTKAFPPAPDSRLVGQWTQRGGLPYSLILYPDGGGVLQRMMKPPVSIGWRPTETGEAVGTEVTTEGKFGPAMTVRLRMDPAGHEMEVRFQGETEALRLTRVVGNAE